MSTTSSWHSVTIYLGSKCNLSCEYCHREMGKETGVTDGLIAKLKGVPNVSFIGGEPTLYMGEIRKVVEALPPTTHYRITTNGTGFKRHEPFFHAHKFFVVVSYDGGDLRPYDPFTEVIDYPYLGVSTTLYHGNTDFRKIFRKFAEKEEIIERPLSFFPHIMHVTNPRNLRYALTIDDMDGIYRQHRQCVERLVEGYEKYGVVNQRFTGLFHMLYERSLAHYTWGETYCANHRISKVDTEGGDWSCLYLRDTKKSDMPAYMEKHFPKCKSCPVYGLCGGACIKSVQHERECYLYRKLYTWWKAYSDIHHTAVEGINENISIL